MNRPRLSQDVTGDSEDFTPDEKSKMAQIWQKLQSTRITTPQTPKTQPPLSNDFVVTPNPGLQRTGVYFSQQKTGVPPPIHSQNNQQLQQRIRLLESDNVKLMVQNRQLRDALARFQNSVQPHLTVFPKNNYHQGAQLQRLNSMLQLQQQRNQQLAMECNKLAQQLNVVNLQTNAQYPQLISEINYLRQQLQRERIQRVNKVRLLNQSKAILERQRELLLRMQVLQRQNKEKQSTLESLREQLDLLQTSTMSTDSVLLKQMQEEVLQLRQDNKQLKNPGQQPQDHSRERQIRNLKLVYETENNQLKLELSNKEQIIMQLVQQLDNFKKGILGTSYSQLQI